MSGFRHSAFAALAAAALFAVCLSLRIEGQAKEAPLPETLATTSPTLRERQVIRKQGDDFRILPLSAKAVAVWDATEGKLLYGRHSDAQLPLASLTKVMLVYVANGIISDTARLTVSGADLAEEGSSGIIAGDSFAFRDLRAATLVASLNDGANTISRAVGDQLTKSGNISRVKLTAVDAMNEMARELGLVQTAFYNEDGLDVGPGQPGALGSAQDAAILFSALVAKYPETLSPTAKDGFLLYGSSGQTYRYFNTNQRLADIPGLLGSKTGYTDLAGGNLAVSFSLHGKTFTVAVLGSTKEGRFDDVARIVEFLRLHSAGE